MGGGGGELGQFGGEVELFGGGGGELPLRPPPPPPPDETLIIMTNLCNAFTPIDSSAINF